MAGERQRGAEGGPDPAQPIPDETVKAQAFVPGTAADAGGLVEAHRRAAERLLKEGAPQKAFAELVRASRSVPMTPRLAAALVSVALRARAERPATAILSAGISDAEGAARAGVRRQLARLLRRSGGLEGAREQLILLLAEKPGDRRARTALNALLQQEGRWEELDASLEKETKEAIKRRDLRHGARALLLRGRLWAERLGNPGHAAMRFAQAADLLDQARDFEGALNVRLLWLRALRDAGAPASATDAAVRAAIDAGERVGKGQRARALAHDLGLHPGAASEPFGGEGPAASPKAAAQALISAAEDAASRGRGPEATALLAAAALEEPGEAIRKLEAHYVARGAWRDLALFYRERAARTSGPEQKVELLARLAEVLEDELQDLSGAARSYAEIVRLTGDKRALEEQVRILRALDQTSGVKRALDEAVESAADDRSRASAHLARGEAALAAGDADQARRDFQTALAFAPGELAASAGMAEAAAKLGSTAPILSFRDALAALPRHEPCRADLYRRLARLAEKHLPDGTVARVAWSEVLADSSLDTEAQARLAELARQSGDSGQLEQALRVQLRREPRGPESRKARVELVALLDRTGRRDQAFEELMAAVRFEPGHREAWLELVERLTVKGDFGQGAWALEHAATSTEGEVERAATWDRLARYCRERLHDDARAATYALRAETLRVALDREARRATPLPAAPPATPAARTEEIPHAELPGPAAPRAKTPPAAPRVEAPAKAPAPDLSSAPARPPFEAPPLPPPPSAPFAALVAAEDESRAATVEVPIAGPPPLVPIPRQGPAAPARPPDPELPFTAAGALLRGEAAAAGRGVPTPIELPAVDEVPSGAVHASPRTAEVDLGAVRAAISQGPPPLDDGTGPEEDGDERTRLFAQVRANPLDPDGYQHLADHFDRLGDLERGDLMAELAGALEGVPEAPARVPKLILSASDRSGLRHPLLRNEAGELLSLAGQALCHLYPSRGRAAGGRDRFHLQAGPGAAATADALLSAVRILGLRSPDVYLAEDNGPPFSLAFPKELRMLVGRAALRSQLPGPELRFFAGRALFTQNPDLLALRTLSVEQLEVALGWLESALFGGRKVAQEAKVVRDALPPKAISRLKQLLPEVKEHLEVESLVEGARHSANRAGLMVAGAVSPALAALRAKKALEPEIVELVRFAGSERYLKLRRRRLER